MAQYMTTTGSDEAALANLETAMQNVGSGAGTGETFLKIDDRTGAMTYGQERIPFPDGHRMVVGLHGFRHGYIDMQGGQVVDRAVVPMVSQPTRPVPPGCRYGSYSKGGPRNVTEIELNSIDEPGFRLVFTAWGTSSANCIRNLLGEALQHARSPDGQAGFKHPVIVPRAGKYPLKGRPPSKEFPEGIAARDIWHFDYEIVDWLHVDGSTLLSTGARPAVEGNGAEEPAPWEDAEDDLPT